MTRNDPKLRLKILRLLRPWHRRLGLLGVGFITFLAISGILINHSNDLAIDTNHVEQAWLLDHYGIKTPNHLGRYQFSSNNQQTTFNITDNLLWLGNHKIWESNTPVIAVTEYLNFHVAITQNVLVLISDEGQILEQQDASTGLPQNISALGVESNQLWLKADGGQYQADEDLIEWQAATSLKAIDWITPPSLTGSERQEVALLARSAHLSWEKVLLDLHSGRFFGRAGQLFMDLVAICLLLICCSGFFIWYKQKAPKHPK